MEILVTRKTEKRPVVFANFLVATGDWYRIFTAALLHGGLMHIGFNMYALYLFGPRLEQQVGSPAFAALYVASAATGGLTVVASLMIAWVSIALARLGWVGLQTLQLALADVPMVVGYRVNALTASIARRVLRIPHIALVNLVAERGVVPERIQTEMTGERLAAAVAPLLEFGSDERNEILVGLDEVRSLLGEPGAADRVADSCVTALASESRP